MRNVVQLGVEERVSLKLSDLRELDFNIDIRSVLNVRHDNDAIVH